MTREEAGTFRTRLATLIKASGKKKCTIAEGLGVAKTTVSAWTTGQNVPRPPVMRTIAAYFGVSPEWLAGEEKGDSTP